MSDGLSGDEVEFVGQLLTANATWSAGIHNAALDGQERSSNEWATRYLLLVNALESSLHLAPYYERDTELFDHLGAVLGRQSFWPDHAAEQTARYRERLQERAEAVVPV